MNKSKRLIFCICLLVIFGALVIVYKDSFIFEFLSLTIALGGLLGLYFQLKDSKNSDEGSFITQLNDSFNNNPSIQKIYKKLQMGEPITEEDTPDIVAYLTYFETIGVLLKKNTLDFNTLNNLFSYRFFLAINNEDIQRISLIRYDTEYINLYKLENKWNKYLQKISSLSPIKGMLKTVNPNYELLISDKKHNNSDILIRKAELKDAEEIYQLMKKVYNELENKSLFVCDSIDYVINTLLKNGFAVVAENKNKIIGSFIIRYPFSSEDNLGIDINLPANELNSVAHFESVVVDGAFRGMNLQSKMLVFAEGLIDKRKFYHFVSTVSPENIPSIRNFEKNSFITVLIKEKYNGLTRNIMYKKAK